MGVTHKSDNLTLLEQIKLAQAEEGLLQRSLEDKRYQVEDDCLLFRGKIVIPHSLKFTILETCHDLPFAGHPGVQKTFELLSCSYWWPTIWKDCNSYVDSCELCARSKPDCKKPAGLLSPLPILPHPWHSISMDFITDLPPIGGVDSVLVVIDRFSKMAHFIGCSKTINSFRLADIFMEHIVRLHSFPHDIVSDRGSIFVSKFWSSFLRNYGVSQLLLSAYHPQTDGQTEYKSRFRTIPSNVFRSTTAELVS